MRKNLNIFLILFSFFADLALAENFRVVIDPGHGGQDLGAVRDSFIESKIALEISKKLKSSLSDLKVTDVHLTREKDITLSLKDRVSKANQMGADLFVSLHANTSTLARLSGMEFYFNFHQRSATTEDAKNKIVKMTNNEVVAQIKKDFKLYEKTEKSLSLSKSVQHLTSVAGFGGQPGVIKRAPFYVIENTEMPSVLIELGFISNRREAQKLTNPDYQKELADLIAHALISYKEKSDKTNTVIDT